MFYSHQILARKGPLATVWVAAHLQHRLKKSHYTSTDISSTVDRIMFPEAPIALRMSGHLLLGVVRIYSKKVDYLHQDCNVILIGVRKLFASTELNLPESAANAPPESVTLPDRFELDALDLDDDLYREGDQDKYLRSQEDITLPDQIPVEKDFYVAITFDEDIFISPSQPVVPYSGVQPMQGDDSIFPSIQVAGSAALGDPAQSNQAELISERNGASDSGVRPMEEDTTPPLPVDTNVGVENPGPSNQTGIVNEGINAEISPQSFPEIEVMRDATHDIGTENLLVWPDFGSGTTELRPDDQIPNEKETLPPLLEDILLSGGPSLPFQEQSKPPASATSAEVPEIFDTRVSFGHLSHELVLRSTPPGEQQPKPRSRKRKRLIDETIVLTNKYMKTALKDPRNLLRKRKPRPGSLLGDWKLRNKLRAEQIFHEPSITGICPDLSDIFKQDFISAQPHLVASDEAFSEPRVAQSPAFATDLDMENERLRVVHSPPPIPDLDIEVEHPRVAQSSVPVPDLDMEIEHLRVAQSSVSVPDLDMEIEHLRVAQSSVPVPDLDMEIERLRQHEGNVGGNVIPEFMPSSSTFMASQFKRNVFTPVSANNLGSDGLGESTIGTGFLSTPNMAASAESLGSEMETPITFVEQRIGLESGGLSDIPEFSAEAEELNFLEADNTPTSSQGKQNVDTLSVRTRAVAQYLKRHSPVSQISENLFDLSLNKILEGKPRKLCARMFFETLVLKSNGLVDVRQEEPYGDIDLKLTPTFKAQF